MEDKSVEPTIKRNLAGQPTFRCGPLCKLKQIGFHAVIGEPSDPLDPGAIDMNVACGASAWLDEGDWMACDGWGSVGAL